jgi:hypothetical protein
VSGMPPDLFYLSLLSKIVGSTFSGGGHTRDGESNICTLRRR